MPADLSALLDLVQEKYAMRLLAALLEGPRGFNELRRAVDAPNPNTIAARLDALEAAGLVAKTVLSLRPPRNRYELTAAGHAFRVPMFALHAWATRWLGEAGPDTVLGLVGEKWTVPLVRALLGGPRGFNELARDVGANSPSVLAARLARLEELGVVRRTVLSVQPPRNRYTLSESGEAARAVFEALDAWAAGLPGLPPQAAEPERT